MAVQAKLLTLTGTRQKRSMYHFGILPFASPVWATADFYYQSFRKSFVVFPMYRAEQPVTCSRMICRTARSDEAVTCPS